MFCRVDKLEIVVEPHSEEKLTFSWTPTSAGIVSESVAFDLNDGRCRMQCKIVGEAIEPPKPKVQRRPTANRENQKVNVLSSHSNVHYAHFCLIKISSGRYRANLTVERGSEHLWA